MVYEWCGLSGGGGDVVLAGKGGRGVFRTCWGCDKVFSVIISVFCSLITVSAS